MKTLEQLVKGVVLALPLLGACEQDNYFDTGFGERDYVLIDPESPQEDDNLSCYVDGFSDYEFDFFWRVDGETVWDVRTKGESKLAHRYIEQGDNVQCYVYLPSSYGSNLIGWENVDIREVDYDLRNMGQ